MKKFVSFLLVLTMALGMSTFAFANDLEDISENSESDYYQEKGQINLRNLELDITDTGKLIIKGDDIKAKNALKTEISRSNNLTDTLKEYIEDGSAPVAIGYTRVYLKEVSDENGMIHLEPKTEAEVLSDTTSGPKEKKGNLTLYTTAFATKQGITVESIAQWGNAFQLSQENTQAGYDDYLSAATNSNYIVNSSDFSATTTYETELPKKFYNKKDENDYSVVYSFKEMVENAYAVKTAKVTMHCGKNGTLPKTVKSTSKYVHTWGSGKITIGFGIGGPSFGLTDCKKSWQIASSVNVPSA